MGAHTDEFAIQRGQLFTPTAIVLAVIVAIGFFFIGMRFMFGLTEVSNLSQGFPWGIWITYDVATGTAFACGGYAIAITTYIMNRMQYHPLIRSAILTSMFGYMFAGLSVVVDLARYWNMYGFFMPNRWNFDSAMLEVALCVMSYNVVLILEFLPALLERLKDGKYKGFWSNFAFVGKYSAKIYSVLNPILFIFVCIGITLPTMHQSSLGALMITAGDKVHPLWQTGWLPLLFLLNALYLGYAVVIFEAIGSSLGFGRPFEIKETAGLSKFVFGVTAIWFAVRFYDLMIGRGVFFEYAFNFDVFALNFWGEILCLAVGALVLLKNSVKPNLRQMFLAATLFLLGGGWYRFNAYTIGYTPLNGYKYFPSIPEFMITLSFIALEILLYITLVKLLPIMAKPHEKHA